jgi:hypothetical protein
MSLERRGQCPVSRVLATNEACLSGPLVPEGPNVYRTRIAQNLKAPEERNVLVIGPHCAPPELHICLPQHDL